MDNEDEDDEAEEPGSEEDEEDEMGVEGEEGEEQEEEKDVDFAEEDDEDEDDEVYDGDVTEAVETADPFETHFASPDVTDVARRIKAIKEEQWAPAKVVVQGSREMFSTPQVGASSSSFSPPPPITSLPQLKLKKRLADANTGVTQIGPLEQKLAPLLFNYYDTLFCERKPENGDELRRLASLHAVNHVFK